MWIEYQGKEPLLVQGRLERIIVWLLKRGRQISAMQRGCLVVNIADETLLAELKDVEKLDESVA